MTDVIAQIDAEIARLQQAKNLLSGSTMTSSAAPAVKSGRRGRPKGSKNASKGTATKGVAGTAAKTKSGTRKKRTLSPEGRKAIADAMKRRWAERRKQTVK